MAGQAKKHLLSDAFKNAHGQLHHEMGVPAGQKIPMGRLEKAAGPSDHNALERRRARAALNMERAHGG